MKKIIVSAISMILCAAMLCAPVFATGGAIAYGTVEAKRFASPNSSAVYAIYKGVCDFKESIDISSYNVTQEEISEVITYLLDSYPELFYISLDSYFTYNTVSGYVIDYIPTYTMSPSEVSSATAFYRAELTKIAESAKNATTTEAKIIAVNDYMCVNFAYDTTYKNYDAYTFLKTKKGVCQAYSRVFSAVMNILMIPCKYANSESMNHIWNIVQIDGAWYHADITWNDPVPDMPTYAGHDYLLFSDSVAASLEHTSWDAEKTCTSTRFNNAPWKSANRTAAVYGADVYFVNSESFKLIKYNTSTSSSLTVGTITDMWPASGSSYWSLAYSSVAYFDGHVFFNTPNSIICYEISSGTSDTAYTYKGDTNIYGFTADKNGGAVVYNATSYNMTNVKKFNLNLGSDAFAAGDANGDYAVNIKDCVLIMQYLAKWNVSLDLTAADANGDGKITVKDATIIMQYLAGWSVVLG